MVGLGSGGTRISRFCVPEQDIKLGHKNSGGSRDNSVRKRAKEGNGPELGVKVRNSVI